MQCSSGLCFILDSRLLPWPPFLASFNNRPELKSWNNPFPAQVTFGQQTNAKYQIPKLNTKANYQKLCMPFLKLILFIQISTNLPKHFTMALRLSEVVWTASNICICFFGTYFSTFSFSLTLYVILCHLGKREESGLWKSSCNWIWEVEDHLQLSQSKICGTFHNFML